ncbi:MAG: acyl-CoA desaturase [Silanimonas sp.]|nr:MAG: acyl-CoA desaturase [Silanimonas sp.]
MSPAATTPLLTGERLEAFGAELDALREKHVRDLGAADARYIRRVRHAVRWSEAIGRLALYGAAPAPWMLWPLWCFGVFALAVSKILDNMELGHNVIHGQYDWMNDPSLQGDRFQWDHLCPTEWWRETHNHRHHQWTNVRGKDDDVGYGLLRIFPEQRWTPFALGQPLYALLLAVFYQTGIAIQNLQLGKYLKGRRPWREFWVEARPLLRKLPWQGGKDYVVFPLLAGPYFLPVLLGNMAANLARNLWTFVVIFCGHFTRDAITFTPAQVKDETRAGWYQRQIRGSSNISGGFLMHLMTGNLSHQIEHHLFPDLPARRYAAIASEVRAICAKYGVPYNTGSLPRQFGSVLWRLFRHAFPSRPRWAPAPA